MVLLIVSSSVCQSSKQPSQHRSPSRTRSTSACLTSRLPCCTRIDSAGIHRDDRDISMQFSTRSLHFGRYRIYAAYFTVLFVRDQETLYISLSMRDALHHDDHHSAASTTASCLLLLLKRAHWLGHHHNIISDDDGFYEWAQRHQLLLLLMTMLSGADD